MKFLLSFFLCFLFICSFGQIENAVPKRPIPPRLVNDYTQTLTEDERQSLEDRLVAFDDSTSNQIAVIIVPTTGDYDIQEYALAILRKWGIGNKKTNNGVVFLISKNDHHMRIETGYGLEGAIPDITSKEILDNIVTPKFRSNEFYGGISAGVNALMLASKGEYVAPTDYHQDNSGLGIPWWMILMAVVILIIFFSSASGGGPGSTYVSRRGGAWWLGNVIGSLSSGGWSGGGGGGGWSGGGGGGFGGFGGGSGGGGGASGGW